MSTRVRSRMTRIALAAAVLLAGCASDGPWADPRVEEYKAEIDRLNAPAGGRDRRAAAHHARRGAARGNAASASSTR